MYFLFSLVPATFAVVVGYFVLFSSTKAQGPVVRALGQVLAIWVFVLAALSPMAGAYATYAGLPSVGAMMRSMHAGR